MKEFSKEDLERKGWLFVGAISGKGFKTWKSVIEKTRQDGYGEYKKGNDWFKVPFEVEVQELFKVSKKTLNSFKLTDTTEKLRAISNNVITTSCIDPMFTDSKGWAMSMENLAKITLCLKYLKVCHFPWSMDFVVTNPGLLRATLSWWATIVYLVRCLVGNYL